MFNTFVQNDMFFSRFALGKNYNFGLISHFALATCLIFWAKSRVFVRIERSGKAFLLGLFICLDSACLDFFLVITLECGFSSGFGPFVFCCFCHWCPLAPGFSVWFICKFRFFREKLQGGSLEVFNLFFGQFSDKSSDEFSVKKLLKSL